MAANSVVLTELKERFDYGADEWRDIRDDAKTDMRYVAGDPWAEKDRRQREDAGRPVLSLDELGQYINQLINEIRQHKRAIRVTPTGSGAKDALANFRANLIRQIEYRSNAQQAYTTMFENTVQRSYGFLRVKAKYVSERSFNQELLIEPTVNPETVTVDPDTLKPDGSDMAWAFIDEMWSYRDFKRRWPKAEVQSFQPEYGKEAPRWINESRVRVAEYWTTDTRDRQLLMVLTENGRPSEVFYDELLPPKEPKGAGAEEQFRWQEKQQKWERDFRPLIGLPILRDRAVEYPYICQYRTNGVELLPDKAGRVKTEWPGKWIPLVCCYGKVLYLDEGSGVKRKLMSLVRLARDPYMLYCYYRTCEAELIGMTPKFPYFWYEGQLSPEEQVNLAKSLHEPVAGIKVRPTVDGAPNQILPHPTRQPFDPPIQALEIGAEAARRAIQAAMGVAFLPTSAQRRNEKSGIALQEIRSSEQKGSFHFIDHYEMAITRTGAIVDDLIPHYYDTARDVTIRDDADDATVVRINDPQAPDKKTGEPIYTDAGDYDITLSTGPSQDSEREAASDFADSLASQPQIFSVIGDLVVKLKNLGPIGDKISERLKALLPPQVQQLEAQETPIPPIVQQKMQQLEQVIDTLSKELDAKNKLIETEQVKAEANLTLASAKANTDAQLRMAELQQELLIKFRELEVKIELELAKLGSAQAMKRAELEQQELHQHDQATLQREQQETASAEAELDRQAERDQATMAADIEPEDASR